ncbi:hypothetical protein A2415_02805 [candidate division WWE3 bacterium RIFOXYC1_FULL_39_7]|uniref:Uncharacterized protein n=2 Tax=Katanobacteria TaxID=422282 RepID=A0A1F4X4T1_UNCKA|nr:MAG: hypothetical protein A2415_02805 [candidate division WWE3 bacterium RIFOXYC1_FULL_39_7]OGC76626.1 MAG: hypothetical protein A2619_04195 [candidate division WWE3 bacterium RIFOXYD1_FULL_39_9]
MELLQSALAQVSTVVSDPLGGRIASLTDLLAFVLNLVLGVGFALVLIMLALGFIQYIMSQGDKAGVEKAQKWVTYAVVGGVGLFLVFVLRAVITQFTGGNNVNVGTNVTL